MTHIPLGHQFLFEQGILHRHISAGTILLAAEEQPDEGHEGFLMEFEFAHHAQPWSEVKTGPPLSEQYSDNVDHRVATASFHLSLVFRFI